MNLQRLDKIVSSAKNISRTDARRIIRQGKITVGGEVMRDISLKLNAEDSQIEYLGQALSFKEHIYILMNKPKGILSASNDKSRKTVVDLVPDTLKRAELFPVGRLDKDTTGLLIITDDGDFAHKVISPKKNISKCYSVVLDGTLTNEMIDTFAEGVVLADGTTCKPAQLKIIDDTKAEVVITEGKYHQIKRMFGTVGLGVVELERISIGKMVLPQNLPYGQCKELSKSEICEIFDN